MTPKSILTPKIRPQNTEKNQKKKKNTIFQNRFLTPSQGARKKIKKVSESPKCLINDSKIKTLASGITRRREFSENFRIFEFFEIDFLVDIQKIVTRKVKELELSLKHQKMANEVLYQD